MQLQALTVTGMLRDLPHNTQIEADVLVPNTSVRINPAAIRTNWFWIDGWSYVRLAPGADSQAVTAKFPPSLIAPSIPCGDAELTRQRGDRALSHAIHPGSSGREPVHDMTPPGSWTTVYGFVAIGVLILLIACFNFTNLATARAMMRAREISLRKVVGAKRRQLIVQFLGESVLTALIALMLALALIEILLPVFDRSWACPSRSTI